MPCVFSIDARSVAVKILHCGRVVIKRLTLFRVGLILHSTEYSFPEPLLGFSFYN